MLQDILKGINLHEYSKNIRRFFLFATLLFSGMALFMLLYNLYLTRLGFQEDFIGQMAGMFPLASGIFALPIGVWSDRIGRKPFLIVSSLSLGISYLGLCLLSSPILLLAFSFIGGIAGSCVFVNFIPFLAENAAPERRGQAIAIWMAIGGLTRMVTSLAGGWLPGLMGFLTGISTDQPEPFRYALLLGASLTLVSIFPAFRVHERKSLNPGPAPEQDPTPRPEAPVKVPWKLLATFTSISAFRGLSMGLSLPFFNVFFQEELHTSAAAIGTIFFLCQVAVLPSTLSAPALSRRFGATATVVPLRLLGVVCLSAIGWTLHLPLAVVFLLFISVVEGVSTPTEMSFATDVMPRRYLGRMQSLRVTGFQLLSALGSIWAGGLILRFGYGVSFGLAGLALLVSATIFGTRFNWRKGQPASTHGG